jgi:hypothetical protein
MKRIVVTLHVRFLHPLNGASRLFGHRSISTCLALFVTGAYAPCLHYVRHRSRSLTFGSAEIWLKLQAMVSSALSLHTSKKLYLHYILGTIHTMENRTLPTQGEKKVLNPREY